MASVGAKDEELAKRAAAELKQTEELLAGFDRPGRTPRAPPAKRDFVDYHMDKGHSKPAASSPRVAVDRTRHELPTAIVHRHGHESLARWTRTAALATLVGVIGGVTAAATFTHFSGARSSRVTNDGAMTAPDPIAPGVPGALTVDPTHAPTRGLPPSSPDPVEAAFEPAGGAEAGPCPACVVSTSTAAAPSVAPATATARSAPASSNRPLETAPSASSAPSATPTVDLIRHL